MTAQNPIFPRRLSPGDTVAVLSPSWGGPHLFPHVFDLGLRNLTQTLGVQVREFPTTRMSADALYRDPKARAADINAAFADPDIRAIFASIGGDDCVRILPYLDLPTILANPKILMGYSDTTTLTAYLAQKGLVTFNGPAIMAGFAQLHRMPIELGQHLRTLLTEPIPIYDYAPFPNWVDAYRDWGNPAYDGDTEPFRPHEGWRWIQGEAIAQGRLFGGCIEVLEFMKATPFWPSPDFWSSRILFLETSEDKPTVDQVVWMLRNYGSIGALGQLAGLLLGRARSYSDAEKESLYEAVARVVSFEFDRPDLPILANLDFGHTDPQWILPLNVLAEIDPKKKRFSVLESPVA
jgi:muramoyltetrapeptide carboxypeptidase LdcA involved in peptidoglycan recycling